MTNFTIVDKIPIDSRWSSVDQGLVSDNGAPIAKDYYGKCFRLIKQERNLSFYERLARALQAIWLIIRSFGKERSSEQVKKLWSNQEIRYLGTRTETLPPKIFSPSFPTQISYIVLSFLNAQSLATCQIVNWSLKTLASHEPLWKALPPKIAFGKQEWATYFGDVGKEPPLPKIIHKLIDSGKYNGKPIRDTHSFVLIPKTIDGKPFTLETLFELVKSPKKGHPIRSTGIENQDLFAEIRTNAAEESHWVLFPHIQNDGKRNFDYETTPTTSVNSFWHPAYIYPDPLEIFTAIFMPYIRSGRFPNENDKIIAIGKFNSISYGFGIQRNMKISDILN